MGPMEPYTHTRNYGCRIRNYTQDGIEMLSMENAQTKIVFALGKGADIVELMHKPSDTDFLWHSFNTMGRVNHIATVESKAGNFLDTYAGGWQDLFPTYGAPANFAGAEIGIHGESCLYPWSMKILKDEPSCIQVELSLRTVRTPFVLRKTISIEEGSAQVAMHQRIENVGSTAQDFMWGQHPAFGTPFLDENVRLHLKGAPNLLMPQYAINPDCPMDVETSGPWPCLPDRNGDAMDLSRAYGFDSHICMEYAVMDFAVGEFELVNHKTKLGVRMNWDKEIFPYLWIWGLYGGLDGYPWFGRGYTMGVEPWSTMPSNYDTAKQDGKMLHLDAGQVMETDICVEPFIWEE